MAKMKKLGTFGGVFTPSILTILGVIMYLRLPWIVGHAGMWKTIGIILLAHIISISTGLSVSSIATDKKVKTGGTYFMIARSLGLPIGGTLGLALFVGLSFSVSLYLIGFSESFLSFLGMDVTKEMIRLTGSVALIAVTGITIISTKFAIKTQYLIMLAIGLSLISIFTGSHPGPSPAPLLSPVTSTIPFIVLFGIFFPAVTGFEAGVSMSGDLEDPKRSIPFGTILAIGIGLIVYIGLSVFLAKTVSADQLANNPNILLEISWFSPLVLAGIWGATISSALGSILGAPRILQATALDKITPQFFAKGYGKDSEPRNAMMLTFVIAEAGILIGELDAIARIVSMFFITTYGFLNMSAAIEVWASPDFRPEFRVPKLMSIIGSVTAFIVMIQLDIVAMISASVILILLFLYLQRKELSLESGDTWEGVWSSVVRTGLRRLLQTEKHTRNWRPNIVLFSGGATSRPHLIDFGRWIVDKRGILSDFILHEKPDQEGQFRKIEQIIPHEEDEMRGVFHRQAECRDIYEGMNTISKFYGFSGIEPNTLLLGWAKSSGNPLKFTQTLKNFISLDYNLLLMNYDNSKKFGQENQIDVWWQDQSNNMALALAIMQFITTSDRWRAAKLRILVVQETSGHSERIHKNLDQILSDHRIDADVVVINNAIEQKSFRDVIRTHSENASMIFLGLPDIQDTQPVQFIDHVTSLIRELGTVILMKASSYFQKLMVGSKADVISRSETGAPVTDAMMHSAVSLPDDPVLAEIVERFQYQLQDLNRRVRDEIVFGLLEEYRILSQTISEFTDRNFSSLVKNLTFDDRRKDLRILLKSKSEYLFQAQRILTEFQSSSLERQKNLLIDCAGMISDNTGRILDSIPSTVAVIIPAGELAAEKTDPRSLRWLKAVGRMKSRWSKALLTRDVCTKRLAEYYLIKPYSDFLRKIADDAGIMSYLILLDLTRQFSQGRDSLVLLENRLIQTGKITPDDLDQEIKKLSAMTTEFFARQIRFRSEINTAISIKTDILLNSFRDDLTRLDTRYIIRRHFRWMKKQGGPSTGLSDLPDIWAGNQAVFLDMIMMELQLLSLKNRVRVIVNRIREDLEVEFQANVFSPLDASIAKLNAENNGDSETAGIKLQSSSKLRANLMQYLDQLWSEIQTGTGELPESMEVIDETSVNQLQASRFEEASILIVSYRRLVEYFFETLFIVPLEENVQLLDHQIHATENIMRDVIRFTETSLNESLPKTIADRSEKSSGLDSKNVLRLQREKEKLTGLTRELFDFIEEKLTDIFDRLNPYVLTRSAGNLQQYIRTQKTRKAFSVFEMNIQGLWERMNDQLVSLLYRWSQGILFARKLQSKGSWHRSHVEELVRFSESVSPLPHILESLPYYYRQLFLSKPGISSELWVGNQKEISLAATAIARYRRGAPGGLLILGERNSGKTALSQYIADTEFPRQKVFLIKPPSAGSGTETAFKSEMESALQQTGSQEEMVGRLPENTVLIIDDLEKWWERSREGYAVINRILSLIEHFGDHCYFIVNMNVHSFRFVNSMIDMESYFLSIIHCEPFDAKDLKDIILLRHRSTGLRFRIGKAEEGNISDWKLAKFFTALFDISRGNVGIALGIWIALIEQVNRDEIVLSWPEMPDMTILERISTRQIMILLQFILHQQLTEDQLKRIVPLEPTELHHILLVLKRCGVLRETGVYLEISPFVQPFLNQQFAVMGVL